MFPNTTSGEDIKIISCKTKLKLIGGWYWSRNITARKVEKDDNGNEKKRRKKTHTHLWHYHAELTCYFFGYKLIYKELVINVKEKTKSNDSHSD